MKDPAKTILIVEDEAIIAMQEIRYLEEEGYKTIYARYGEEAIEIVRSGRDKINLILMDIDLGSGIDGTDTAREILKDHDIPVVFLSSHTEKEIVGKTEEITSYGYVVKNSGETVLTASIRMAFRLFDAYQNIQLQKIEIETANKKLNSTIEELHSAIETLKSTNEKFEIVNDSLTISQIELKKNQAILQSMLNATPTGVGLIVDRVFQKVNTTLCKITGYTAEEMVGENTRILYADEDEYLRVGRKLYSQMNKSEPAVLESQLRRKNGSMINVQLCLSPFNPDDLSMGVTVTVLDITEFKQTVDALQESERRLLDIIQFFPDAVLIINLEGRVTGWNHAMENLTGIKAGDIIGKGDYEHSLPFYGERRPMLIDLAMRLDPAVEIKYTDFNRSGNLITGEAYMPNLRGGQTYLFGTATVLYNSQGELAGAIESIRDITARKQAEEGIKKLAKSLERINAAFLNLGPDYNTNIMRLTILCGELLGASFAIYSRLKDDKLLTLGIWNTPGNPGPEFPAEGNICYEIIKNTSDTAIVFTDLQTSTYSQSDPKIQALGIKTYLGHSVKCNHVNIGSLCAMYQADYKPTDDDTRIMGIISSAISNEEDMKQTETAIKKNIALYKLVADNSFDVIWAMDLNLKFTYISPSVKRMTGWTPEEAMELTYDDFILPEYLPEINRIITDELARPINERKSSIIIEYRQYAKDGSILFIESTVTWTYGAEGNTIGIQGINRLINDRKAAEEALAKTLDEKEILLREIQHRMKNSLGIITGLIGLEADHSADPLIGEICSKIKDRIMSLTKLYDMLYHSKEIKEIWLNRYLYEVISSLFASYSGRKNLFMEKDMDEVRIDVKRAIPMGLILNELLTNALKYAFPDGRDGTIKIIIKCQDDIILLEVRDNGAGLPADFNIEHSYGLGFQLIKMLTRQISGKLEWESGKETVFRIIMPLYEKSRSGGMTFMS